MERKAVSGIMLTLLLIGMLTLAFNIQPVKASGTIYIRADGSVDPDTAPISSTDSVTYTFTGNIYDQIVVERDNIVVDGAGYTVQGTGSGTGIDLSGKRNVTIKNMEIKSFGYGIWLCESSNNSITKLLRVGFAWPTYIDPAVGSDYSSSSAFTNLYDPLLFPTTTGGVKPWVAESWTVSEDGLTWNFTLRDDITFHSGRQLKADDVLFSMARLIMIGEGYAYLFSPYVDLDASTVIDDYKVQFKLKKTFGPFLITLARLYIVDKEEVLDHIVDNDLAKGWLLTHDAGSGPYKVKEVVLEDHVYMERFDDYWAEMKPNSPEEIRMLALAVPTTEETMLLGKELEISSQWLPEEMLEALSKAGLVTGSHTGGDLFYLMMHCRKPPLDDIHIRKALAYAMDYETVVEEVYLDCPIAKCVVPMSLAGAVELPMYRQNLTAAVEELNARNLTRFPNVADIPEIELHWCAEVPPEERVAMLFAESAEAIGLRVKIVKTPWGSMIAEMADIDLSPHIESIYVVAHYPEAGSLLESRYHSKSMATWEQNEWLNSTEIDDMIEDALSTVNDTERFQKYEELERYILYLCPSLFLFDHLVKYSYQPYVVWPNVVGESIPVMGYNIDGRTIEVIPCGPTYRVLSIKLSGEHDYLFMENVKIRVAALVADAETMEPVSNADVVIEIYDPDGELWVSANMMEKLPATGIYEWESAKTIRKLMWRRQLRKGVYLVYVQASYKGGPTATDILEFHIDPPQEQPIEPEIMLLVTMIAIIGIIASVWYIDHRRLSRKLYGLQETKH